MSAAADKLVEAMREVLRISDRKHNAWDAAKAAIAAYEAEGLALRDKFAGMSIAPLLATPFYQSEADIKGAGEYAGYLAHEAYDIADAMLKERAGKGINSALALHGLESAEYEADEEKRLTELLHKYAERRRQREAGK